jgi:hypothetical protein
MFTPALRELQEAHSIRNGLASSPQDKPQDKDKGKSQDFAKGPETSLSGKGMKQTQNRKNGKKDRNRWDHPSAREPP